MKYLIILAVLILISTYVVTFMPTEASSSNASNATVTIECPLYIQTGIVNLPEGWSPLVAPGGARINFQEVVIGRETGKPDIGCYYSNQKAQFAFHSLHRTMPANFRCAVDREPQGSESHSRIIICTPLLSVKKSD